MAGLGHNSDANTGNWIALSRDIIEHHIVGAGQPVDGADKNKGSFSRLESWLDLLTLANWAERKIDNHGVTTILAPGQTLAGRSALAKRWNWSEKAVRSWLSKLEKEMMITLFCEQKRGQSKGHVRNVLTICNWGKYQGRDVAYGPPESPPKGHPRATQGPQKNKGTKEQGNKEDIPSNEGKSLTLAAGAAYPPQPKRPDVQSGVEVLAAFQSYNATAQAVGLPIAKSLTPSRRTRIAARMREHGGPSSWDALLNNINRSAFLQGHNDRGWRPPGLDWFLNTNNFTKVVEGAYGNGAHASQKPQETSWERMNRLMGGEQHIEPLTGEIIEP